MLSLKRIAVNKFIKYTLLYPVAQADKPVDIKVKMQELTSSSAQCDLLENSPSHCTYPEAGVVKYLGAIWAILSWCLCVSPTVVLDMSLCWQWPLSYTCLEFGNIIYFYDHNSVGNYFKKENKWAACERVYMANTDGPMMWNYSYDPV